MQSDARDLERYLREHIPLSAAMGVRVREATSDRVALFAPLAPNINHRETVFGGSAAALAVLAAWALLHLRLAADGISARLVIQRCEMSYERPIPGDFTATCELADEAGWSRFRTTLERRGRARIQLAAVLMHESRASASFRGQFVAVRA
ncbi:MAG: YiiD C-terminal domain-containing protein [Gammaproteobacteria bacterium]